MVKKSLTAFLFVFLAGTIFFPAFMALADTIYFGETNILPTADSGNANKLIAQSANLSDAGAIQSLSFYVTQASGNLRLGIYDATGPGGGPGAKIAETAQITPTTGWNTANVITPVSLPAGAYWLAYLPSSNSLKFVKASDGSSSGKFYSFTFGTMPTTFSTSPSSTTSHWSFYATVNTPTCQNCGGCSPTGETRCNVNMIQEEQQCTDCVNGQCQPVTPSSWADTFDCGPEQSSSYSFCSGGLMCTFSSYYPGVCYIAPDESAECVPPTVSVICNGYCGGGSNFSDDGGPQCAAGSTQPCANGGIQTCDANGQWLVCDNGSHNICNTQQQCISVAGGGANLCQNDTDCANNTHNECNTLKQCLSFAGAGPNQCQNNNDCADNTHNECNAQQQCVATPNPSSPPANITLGETNILPTADSGNANNLMSQSANLSDAGAIQSLSFYVTQASGNLRLGIYDATGPGGGPGAKIAETAQITPTTGWNTANVITPVSLPAGAYWLAYLPSSNSLKFVKASDGSSSGKFYSFTFGTMPTTFSTSPSSTTSHWSFYATVSTAIPVDYTDQCLYNQDCINGNHSICNTQQQCIPVTGSGANLCQTDTDCANNTHNECNTLKQCINVNGAGSNQCQNNNDCADNTHNECNAQQQCVVADGVGADLCFNNQDCTNSTYDICNAQQQCISVAGVGANRCQNNDDCANNSYKQCNALQQCISASGIGISTCQNKDSCVFGMYSKCNILKQCVSVNGAGYDQCQNTTDCINNTHNECNAQQQCVSVAEVGVDSCQNNNDCANNTYQQCNALQQCISIAGIGVTTCQDNNSCIFGMYSQCNILKQCVSVNGVGADQCQNATDCINNTHNECNAQQQCVVVGGASPDQCQDDSQCIITSCPIGNHKECSGNICICVAGSGADLCQNDSQCIMDPANQPPYADQLASGPGSPCTGIQGTGMAFFQWRYQDIDPDDVEKKFILQIDDNSDFSSPEVYRTFDNLSYPPGTLNQQVVLVKTIPTETFGDFIGYNIDYYWRVMVQSQLPNGPVQSSDWAQAPATFKMTGHPAPSPEFTFTPPNPAIGISVNFSDVSVCYDNNGPAACASYLWNFGDSSPTSALQNPTHSYVSANTYTANLRAYDETGIYCSKDYSVPVQVQGSGLPNWREVSPF